MGRRLCFLTTHKESMNWEGTFVGDPRLRKASLGAEGGWEAGQMFEPRCSQCGRTPATDERDGPVNGRAKTRKMTVLSKRHD